EIRTLFRGRIDRAAAERHGRLSIVFGEGEVVQNLERPCRAEWCAGHSSSLIGERADEDNAFRLFDLAIDKAAPPHAGPHFHAVMKDAARLELEFADFELTALWSPPLREALRLGPSFPHQIARRIESPRDLEFTVRNAGAGLICHDYSSLTRPLD